MNDFIPGSQVAVTGGLAAQTETDSAAQANVQFAQVAADQRLLNLMQASAQLQLFQQFKVIETQAQYDQAIDAFTAAKGKIKELEDLRKGVVAVPTKFVQMVNNLFKQIRDGISRSKDHLGDIIDAKKQKDLQAAELAAKEAAEKVKEGEPEVVEEDGVGVVQMGEGEQTPPPSNVIKSAKGAKVHTRKDILVEVVDIPLFLKTLSSKNKRYGWFTEKADDLVEVKLGVLKQLVKDNRQKKIPGVKVKEITKTV